MRWKSNQDMMATFPYILEKKYLFTFFQVKNSHSHWEINYILKDSFKKLATFRDAEIRRWKELFDSNISNKRELSAITSIFSSLEIRIEYLAVSKNSRSRHLRGFDCSDLKQTATRIFQALRGLNPPIGAIQLPIENAQKGMSQFDQRGSYTKLLHRS